MKPLRTRPESESGFTIIEVVMAMFILLIGMTSLLGLLTFGAALSRTAQLRAGAGGSIEAVVADLEEGMFPLKLDELGDEIVGEPDEILDRPVPGYPGLVYSARATPHPDELGLPGGPRRYRVDVEMSWATGGTVRRRTFTTLLLREVPFGERLRRRFVAGEKPRPAGERTDEGAPAR